MKRTLSFIFIFAFMVTAFSVVAGASTKSAVGIYIDGQAFTTNVQIKDSTTFVGVRKFANTIDSSAKVTYNYSNRTLTISSSKLYMTVTDGSNYIVANGRYLYTPSPIYMRYGVMYAPVTLMAKAFDAKISWVNSNSSFNITRGSGGILSGDKFYREDEVYWLSKIINAESGGEILRGKIAVGSVILNRVRSPYFPNTIYSVIFDRKNGVQFSPAANGSIYKSANAQSIIAAKICLEGYSENTSILYFVNPKVAPNSWVGKNRQLYAQIGNHAFYY
ncbi:MAG: cell wall hydrolase [Clostridia bacterium]|nr:cell wall hydrolase [Clostridia bacterium]